jgi:hypothetical protein
MRLRRAGAGVPLQTAVAGFSVAVKSNPIEFALKKYCVAT